MKEIIREISYMKTDKIKTYQAINGVEYESKNQALEMDHTIKMKEKYGKIYTDLMATWVTNAKYNNTVKINNEETLSIIKEICKKENIILSYNIYINAEKTISANEGIHKVGQDVYILHCLDEDGYECMFGGLTLVPVGAECYKYREER